MTKVTNGAISRTFMQKVEEKVEEGGRRTQSKRWRRGGAEKEGSKGAVQLFLPHTRFQETHRVMASVEGPLP